MAYANTNLDNATRLRSELNASTISIQAFFDDLAARPLEYGAQSVSNIASLTDQTPALQAMIDGIDKGGPSAEITGTYYLNGVLHVRPGISLTGSTAVGEILDRTANWLYRGTLILGPSGKIVLHNSAALYKLQIISRDAATPPLLSNPYNAWSRIRAWANTAIEIAPLNDPVRDGGSDCRVEDCTIIGFNTACRLDGLERLTFEKNRVDCLNGVLISNCYDSTRILNNQFWGFWAAHRYVTNGGPEVPNASGPTSGRAAYDGQAPGFMYKDTTANVLYFRANLPAAPSVKWWTAESLSYREGAAIGIVPGSTSAGRVDGCQIVGNLNYGHRNGLLMSGENYATIVALNEFDGNPALSGILPTEGVTVTGLTIFARFLGNQADSHAINYNMNGPSGSILSMTNNVSASFSQHAMYCGACSGTVSDLVASSSTPGAWLVGFSANNGAWAFDRVITGEVGVAGLFNQPDPIARRRISIGHVEKAAGVPFDKRLFSNYGFITLMNNQSVAANVQSVIQYQSGVVNGLGEWGAGYAHHPFRAGVYDYNLVVAFRPSSTASGQFAIEVYKNGSKAYRAYQTTLGGNTELRIVSIPVTFDVQPGDTIDFRIDSQVAGQLLEEFYNTRVTFNQVV